MRSVRRLVGTLFGLLAFASCMAEPDKPDLILFAAASEHEGKAHYRFFFVIYKFDDSNTRRLDSIWTSQTSGCENIRVYPRHSTAIIHEGNEYARTNLRTIHVSDVVSSCSLRMQSMDNGVDYNLYEYNGELAFIRVRHPKDIAFLLKQQPEELVSLSCDLSADSMPIAEVEGEIRLAGVSGVYGGGDHDGVHFRSIRGDSAVPIGIDFQFEGLPVPDSVVAETSWPHYWNLIAYEQEYAALYHIPLRHTYTKCQLILYNRLSKRWTALAIPGPQTSLRTYGVWLAGTVAIRPPSRPPYNTGESPVLTEDIVFVNALTTEMIVVPIGKNAEVLAIDDDGITHYRVDDSLFSATIKDGELRDRKLLMKDRKVTTFHWAFRAATTDDKE